MENQVACDLERVALASHGKSYAPYQDQFCIGGVTVQVLGDRSSDVVLDAEHVPFRVEVGNVGIEIRVHWVRDIPLLSGSRLFDSGTTWRLYEHELGFRFDFGNPISAGWPNKRLLVDHSFRHATLQMSEEYFAVYPAAADTLGYPLDELLIMHRLTQEKAIELHGAGIVRADGIGNLFVGHSGAGKSTTTRMWTEREDVEVLSDDRIIVRREETAQGGATGSAGKVGILRLRENCASRTSHSAQDDRKTGMRMYGTPWHGEAMYASPNSAALTRIFILEHGHGNVLTRLSPSQAVAELFARSFVPFHRHEYVESALTFLQELVDAVPVYHYAFEPDQRAVDVIRNFRD